MYNGAPGMPSNTSMLCLSCHDGVSSQGIASAVNYPSEAWQIGPILTDDHSVSIDYGNAYAARSAEFKAVPDSDEKLINGKLECATSHNVHNPENGLFLRKPNAGSAVCNSYHIK